MTVGDRWRVLAASMTAAVAVVSVAACGGSSGGQGATASTAGSAAGTVPLVVYSAQGYDKTVTQAFQKATGIPVKLVSDSTGPLLAKVAAEKSNPQWSLLWVDGAEAFASLDGQGQLLKGYEPTVDLTAAGQSVVPQDKSYIPTGLTLAGAVLYDPAKTPNPPTSWQEMLSPTWQGKVGMPNPAISGPTYPFVAGTMNQLGGEQQGKDYFTQLKANGLQVFNTNPDSLHALTTGQIKLDLAQSSAAFAAIVKNPSLKVAFLNKVSLLPGAIGIDAKAPAAVQDEAKKFAEFVLSPAGQQAMLTGNPNGDSLYWPLVNGVSPQSSLPSLSSVAYQTVDPYVWGPKENEINTWFTQNIAK
jgi:iron(III) transport system substrate-binding protein